MSEDNEIYINRCAVGCTVMDCVYCCFGLAGSLLFDAAVIASLRIGLGLELFFFVFTIVLLTLGNITLAFTYCLSFCCRFCASGLSCGDYWCCCRFDTLENN